MTNSDSVHYRESRSRQIECGTLSRRILADSKSTLLASTAKQRL
jgi:hypothetical protein